MKDLTPIQQNICTLLSAARPDISCIVAEHECNKELWLTYYNEGIDTIFMFRPDGRCDVQAPHGHPLYVKAEDWVGVVANIISGEPVPPCPCCRKDERRQKALGFGR